MITVFFTPYYKFLQKEKYLKFFNDVDNLSDLIGKIKIKDKIKIYARSKDIIKFQFNNTNSDIEYEFLDDLRLFNNFENKNDMTKVEVKSDWNDILGEYVYFVQDRDLQIKTVNDLDILAFQATDINELTKNIINKGEIGENIILKMFLNDEDLENE